MLLFQGTGVTVNLTGLAATTALGTVQAAIPITVTSIGVSASGAIGIVKYQLWYPDSQQQVLLECFVWGDVDTGVDVNIQILTREPRIHGLM